MSAIRYRDPVDPKDYTRYASWVRQLVGRSGTYVIRDAGTRLVLYVGESHTGRLHSTLTRHFQGWEGFTAGTTYDRFGVEVAVTALDGPSRGVVNTQVQLIRELEPTDNTHHTGDLDLGEDESFDPDDFADDW